MCVLVYVHMCVYVCMHIGVYVHVYMGACGIVMGACVTRKGLNFIRTPITTFHHFHNSLLKHKHM